MKIMILYAQTSARGYPTLRGRESQRTKAATHMLWMTHSPKKYMSTLAAKTAH